MGYIFIADNVRCILYHFYVIGPKVAEIGRIMQNNGYYAIQGHSRSPTLIPIKNPCAISY